MTQEGNSLPDITLLAPIARLLHITLDTLLAFRDELTDEEIKNYIYEADNRLKTESYEEALQWAKGIMEEYPDCEQLIWQMAVVFDIHRLTDEISNPEQYDDYCRDCYIRVLNGEDENIKNHAADSLFGFYLRNEQYEKAEEYLNYFSLQNPERKRKQAEIYSKTGKVQEAYKEYEELLFSGYQMMSMVLHSIYMLAMQDQNMEKAHMLVEKQKMLAQVFEFGEYHEISCQLELAVAEKDADTAIYTMKKMLESIKNMYDFSKSSLYEHMEFKETREEFLTELEGKLREGFKDEETYGFMKGDTRWQELAK